MLAAPSVSCRALGVVLLAMMAQLTISTASECTEKSDIVFIIDSSSSIRETNLADDNGDNWAIMKRFLGELVDRLPLHGSQIRVGVVQFASSVNEQRLLQLDNGLSGAALRQYIESLPFTGGNTNTSGALYFTREVIFARRRPDVSSIALLLTDGLSNIDTHKTLAEARATKNSGIRMFTVGITPEADGDELMDIASDPVAYHHFLSPDFSHLNLLQDRLLSRLCTMKRPPPTPCRDHRADVVFMMDDSGSIDEKNPAGSVAHYNWKLLKAFVVSVVEGLKVGLNDTRVAVIRYSSEAKVIFQLDSFDNTADVVQQIENLDYLAGGTNTSGALRLARQQVFNALRGDRKDVRDIGVIITDGESTMDSDLTVPEAGKLKQHGVRIFAIGITNTVVDKELNAIASAPIEDHVSRVEHFDAVNKLLSSLVWKICNDGVIPGENACVRSRLLTWHRFPGHLIVGHNAARLTDVLTADKCQRLCLQEASCRSVDYVTATAECAISHDNRQTASASFLPDAGVDYYEWNCAPGDMDGGDANDQNFNLTTPEDSGSEHGTSTTTRSAVGRPMETGHNSSDLNLPDIRILLTLLYVVEVFIITTSAQ